MGYFFFAMGMLKFLFGLSLFSMAIYSSSNTIRFATLNTNGLRNVDKQAQVKDFVFVNDIDILFLQETHLQNYRETEKLNIPGESLWAYGTSQSCGVGIIIRYSVDCVSRKLLDALMAVIFPLRQTSIIRL